MKPADSAAITVVIPAYNEAATIANVVQRTLAFADKIIVVDDASTDDTACQMAQLPVLLLRNPNNLGKSRSLVRGMQTALALGAYGVITLDGDGQHLPEDIPRFLDMAARFPQHIIIGSRLADKAAFPRARYYANRVANFWISWAAHHRVVDSQCGFRLYPRSVIETFASCLMTRASFVFESEILIEAGRAGIFTQAVPIAAVYSPDARASHFRPGWDILRITRMVAWKLISRGLDPAGLMGLLIGRR